MTRKYFYVFGRDDCPACAAAQELLSNLDRDDIVLVYVKTGDLDTLPSNWRTVPQIFMFDLATHASVHVGGYDRLVEFLNTLV